VGVRFIGGGNWSNQRKSCVKYKPGSNSNILDKINKNFTLYYLFC
jgi:hypothetical protein